VSAAKENGPPLIYDHQMVFDPKSGGIIVFGGRDVNAAEITYSGLYHYDIEENIWTRLRCAGAAAFYVQPAVSVPYAGMTACCVQE
jgi:hypothetical protein